SRFRQTSTSRRTVAPEIDSCGGLPDRRAKSSRPSTDGDRPATIPDVDRLQLPSHHSFVRDLPSGTVTFLFTDIEGSTRLLHELGDAYAEALVEHRRVLRKAFARHGGVEVDTQGDAFFVAFSRASDALAAAQEGNEALNGPIRVRMGVYTGEPLVTDEGYVGIDVHRAARIAAVGYGGQI